MTLATEFHVPDPLVTAEEAGAVVGVKASTVRQWVARGYLEPDYPAWATARRFRLSKVQVCSTQRRPATWRLTFDVAQRRWLDKA